MNYLWDNVFKFKTKNTDILTALKVNHLFQDLTDREFKLLQNIVHLRKFHVGESVFRQGEAGVGMYMIVKGRIEIFISDKNAVAEEFRDVYITQLTDGDFFGELSLVEENGRRTATAVAREESSLIGFFKPDLLEILSRSPSTGVKIVFRLAEVLGRRLKETTSKVSELRTTLKQSQSPPPLDNDNG
jgi:CRP/FNR family cyclic AMP-dependent transcriptional regulator